VRIECFKALFCEYVWALGQAYAFSLSGRLLETGRLMETGVFIDRAFIRSFMVYELIAKKPAH